jgi:site-specific recombinase XerD
MGIIRLNMSAEMKLRGFSRRTIDIYTHYAYEYTKYYNKSPLQTNKEELKAFLYNLVEQGKSPFTVHLYCASLKFLFSMNDKYELVQAIPKIKLPQRLPTVLNVEEVQLILNSFSSLRMKLLFTLIYSAGLRISEAVRLRKEDFDFVRDVIHIKSSKGNKDRITILSCKAKQLLFRYLKKNSIESLLFHTRKDKNKNIPIRYIQFLFSKAVKKTSLLKKVHVHTLRHSFATHLLEKNVNIFYIMKLLGHSSINSTIIYLHMQNLKSLSISSPLDSYGIILSPTSDEQQTEFDFSLAS